MQGFLQLVKLRKVLENRKTSVIITSTTMTRKDENLQQIVQCRWSSTLVIMLESLLLAGVEAKAGFPEQQEIRTHTHIDVLLGNQWKLISWISLAGVSMVDLIFKIYYYYYSPNTALRAAEFRITQPVRSSLTPKL